MHKTGTLHIVCSIKYYATDVEKQIGNFFFFKKTYKNK